MQLIIADIADIFFLFWLLVLVGYHTKACTDSFAGTSSRYLDEEVLKKVEFYESRLLDSAEKCKEVGVIWILCSVVFSFSDSFHWFVKMFFFLDALCLNLIDEVLC